jgi:hypothetical protein
MTFDGTVRVVSINKIFKQVQELKFIPPTAAKIFSNFFVKFGYVNHICPKKYL